MGLLTFYAADLGVDAGFSLYVVGFYLAVYWNISNFIFQNLTNRQQANIGVQTYFTALGQQKAEQQHKVAPLACAFATTRTTTPFYVRSPLYVILGAGPIELTARSPRFTWIPRLNLWTTWFYLVTVLYKFMAVNCSSL